MGSGDNRGEEGAKKLIVHQENDDLIIGMFVELSK